MKKTVLITGAGGNLGKITTERFLAIGWQVIATVTPGKQKTFMHTADTYGVDLSDEADVQQFIHRIAAKYKGIDSAIFLAGGYQSGSLSKTNGDALKKMIALNFETAYYISKLTFEIMMKQDEGGRLIFMGAQPVFDRNIGKNSVGYTLSKQLVVTLADLINASALQKDVRAFSIIPGIIDTKDNRQAMPQADFSSWNKPGDIAQIIADISNKNQHYDSIIKLYQD